MLSLANSKENIIDFHLMNAISTSMKYCSILKGNLMKLGNKKIPSTVHFVSHIYNFSQTLSVYFQIGQVI